MHRVIFPDQDGVSLVIPAGDYSIEQVAEQAVPEGVPYLIVDEVDLPPLSQQHAWTADFTNPDGHGLSDADWEAKYS
ncbi:hypothetical protein [Zhongshania sp.]|uniref:hypothetical protein n=1 Tax=Zhongshania sp. TaxID=1971902 RepID=UPI00356982D2